MTIHRSIFYPYLSFNHQQHLTTNIIFLLENIRGANIYLKITGNSELNKPVVFQPFSGIFIEIAYLYGPRNHIQNYRIVCKLLKVLTPLDFSTGFERSLLKQSRVYIVILITDVKDQILKNVSWYLILQLKTYPTPNMYRKLKPIAYGSYAN